MSLRTTDNENVALFDAVTGWAYGPVFTSVENAEDFLAYALSKGIEVRKCSVHDVNKLHSIWFAARVDPESGLIREDAPELTS